MIDKKTADMEESKNCSLSKAYNLTDHKILMKTLEHHGKGNDSIELIESFLKDITYFVEIQGFRSKQRQLNECSVIQGSKTHGFFKLGVMNYR